MITKGSILISEPFLGDANFERTVILLCEHNENGSLGYILNKPTNVELATVVPDFEQYKGVLYVGGPVAQNSVHFIHRSSYNLLDDIEIQDGIFWGGNFEELKTSIENGNINSNDIRFFVGYSGWGAGQLDAEIQNKSWIIGNASSDELFDIEPAKFWREILKNMGGRFKALANYPIDPRLN